MIGFYFKSFFELRYEFPFSAYIFKNHYYCIRVLKCIAMMRFILLLGTIAFQLNLSANNCLLDGSVQVFLEGNSEPVTAYRPQLSSGMIEFDTKPAIAESKRVQKSMREIGMIWEKYSGFFILTDKSGNGYCSANTSLLDRPQDENLVVFTKSGDIHKYELNDQSFSNPLLNQANWPIGIVHDQILMSIWYFQGKPDLSLHTTLPEFMGYRQNIIRNMDPGSKMILATKAVDEINDAAPIKSVSETKQDYSVTLADLDEDREIPITWLGVDFTHAAFVGRFTFSTSTRKYSEEIAERCNQAFIKDQKSFDLINFFRRKDWRYEMGFAEGLNAALANIDVSKEEMQTFDDTDVLNILSTYPFNADTGVGMMLIAENLNRKTGLGTYIFVVVNTTERTLLHSSRIEALVSGSPEDYWVNSIYKALAKGANSARVNYSKAIRSAIDGDETPKAF